MPTSAEDAVRESYMRWCIAQDVERRRRTAKRRELLRDDWLGQLHDKVDATFRSPKLRGLYKPHASTECNVFRRVIDKLASVYSFGVSRYLDTLEQTDEYETLGRAMDMTPRLVEANRNLLALNEVVVRPCVLGATRAERDPKTGEEVDVPTGRMRPRLTLQVFTPDQFTPVPFEDDPTELRALLIYRWGVADNGSLCWYVDYWDATIYRVYKTMGSVGNATARIGKGRRPAELFNDTLGPIIHEEEHGYGRLPFAYLHRRPLTDDVINESDGQDLVAVTFSAAMIVMYLDRMGFSQAHLQPTFKGEPHQKPEQQILDAQSVLVGAGDWGVINLQANPDVLLRQLDARINWIAAAYDLPPNAIRLESSTAAAPTWRFDNAALNEARKKQIAMVWTNAERELYDLTARAVARSKYPTTLLSGGRLRVDFGMAAVVGDENAQQELREKQIKSALKKPQDFIAEDNPELSEDEVEAKYEANLEAARRHMEILVPTNAPRTPGEQAVHPAVNGAKGPIVRDQQLPPAVARMMNGDEPPPER